MLEVSHRLEIKTIYNICVYKPYLTNQFCKVELCFKVHSLTWYYIHELELISMNVVVKSS